MQLKKIEEMTVQEIVRELMTRHGFGYVDVAYKCGVTETAVRHWHNKRNSTYELMARRLKRILNNARNKNEH